MDREKAIFSPRQKQQLYSHLLDLISPQEGPAFLGKAEKGES